MHQIDPESETITPDDDSLYLYVSNDIKYGLFEDIVDSYYLDSQIKDDFQCDHDCYSQQKDLTIDSVLDEKGKEEFLAKVKEFTDVFSLRDEIGTCPFIEVHLKLKDETPFFVRPYPMREEQKKVIQKEMDRLKHLGIIHKGLTGYSSPVVLVKWKNQNLYQVCSNFRILNEKLVKINHAFPLVRDCIEQLGRKKCHYLSMIDLRDAFHTL